MARTLTLLSMAVAVAACGSSTAATSAATVSSAGSRPACGSPAAHTLAAGPVSRVYVSGGRTVYGCTRGSAPRPLGVTGPCQGPGTVGPVTVAGRDAAVVGRSCGVDTGSATVRVVRLTDGRTLSEHPAATVNAPESFTGVSGLVLTVDGTVAWIGEASSIVRHTRSIGVYAAVPGRAGVRTLDGGPGVAAGSLRLSGRTVSWRHGATRRRARL